MIESFRQKYAFLSNFYPCYINYQGKNYESVEAAFQAQKCIKEEYKDNFTKLSASSAKILGRQVQLRSDWDEVKDGIMYELCLEKFRFYALAMDLLATGEQELVEGNSWGDTYWGVCNGVGQNKLGKILMRVRDYIKKQL